MQCPRKQSGMTLIELMAVVIILSIIAAIAVPNFIEQVRKARRSDAKQPLFDAAAKLEQYYQDNKGYSGFLLTSSTSPEGYYSISFFAGPTTTSYTLEASPLGDQVKDAKCDKFRLDNLGQKTATGTLSDTECW
jgi:type IV pilus assembly protein PilE